MNSAVVIWLTAIRPKTLPLACAAIILGSSLASFHGFYDGSILLLSLTTALLLQIVSNLANDYGDAISGADNEQRVGPLRVMQAGLVTQQEMKKALALAVCLVVLSGVSLLYVAFAENFIFIIGFLLLGGVAIIAAITYTMGEKPYGYKGYGDISVFVFFGLVAVMGSYALYAQSVHLALLLPASCCGMLCASVLNINNLRDVYTDTEAGKNTLVVKLGVQNAIRYHWGLFLLAEVCTMAYIFTFSLPLLTWLHLIPWLILLHSARKLVHFENSALMNQQLKVTSLATFFYCLLFSVGLIF